MNQKNAILPIILLPIFITILVYSFLNSPINELVVVKFSTHYTDLFF